MYNRKRLAMICVLFGRMRWLLCLFASGVGVLLAAGQSACKGPLDCNAQECVDCKCENQQCVCGGGWSGVGCLTPFCTDRASCSDHGNCDMEVHSIACVCDDGFEGDRCETKKCPLVCKHGGTPNAACSACVGCLGAWSGPNCTSWNSSVPLESLLASFATLANASQAALDSQLPLKPLCRQSQECIGWGVDARTGAPASFPIVKLSYTDASKTFHGFRAPVEAQVTDIVSPLFVLDTQVFARIADYTNFVDSKYIAATPPAGTNGIYSQSFDSVFNAYFQEPDDQALSVCRAVFAVVGLQLPFNPDTHVYKYQLDKFAERAVQSLPPAYDTATNKALYRTFFESYGTSVAVRAFQGGMLEQFSSWPTTMMDEEQLSEAMLARDAGIDFTKTSGVGGHGGDVDKQYIRRLTPIACVGGDPTLCTNATKWTASVFTNPRLVSLEHVPISQLLQDVDLQTAMELAARQLVQEHNSEWDSRDKCPPSCNGRGECAFPSSDCTCTKDLAFGRMCSVPKYPVEAMQELTRTLSAIAPEKANRGEWAQIRSVAADILVYVEQHTFPVEMGQLLSVLLNTNPSKDNKDEWAAIRATCAAAQSQPVEVQFYNVVAQFAVTQPGKENEQEWATIRACSNDILSKRP